MLIGAALVAMVASPRELSFALVSRARSLFLRALSQLVSARTPHSRAGEPSSEARTLPVFFVLCRNPLFCRNSRRSQCALGRCDAIAKEKQKKKKRKSGGRTPTLSAIAGGGGSLSSVRPLQTLQFRPDTAIARGRAPRWVSAASSPLRGGGRGGVGLPRWHVTLGGVPPATLRTRSWPRSQWGRSSTRRSPAAGKRSPVRPRYERFPSIADPCPRSC